MNILWIPHSPSEPGAHRRDQYFIRLLKERHRVVTVTWQTWKSAGHLKAYWEGLRFYPVEQREVETFHVRRIPDPTRLLRRGGKYTSVGINQRFFEKDIRAIVQACDIDVLVAGPSSFMTGFPPFDLPIPFVFDYLDCADWDAKPNHPEKTYLQGCDAVLSVSAIAEERAEQYGKESLLLPNGADVRKMRNATGDAVRKKWGLEGARVVSLIGLTCSPRLYFLEAVRLARQRIPNLKCLLVGKSESIEAALEDMPDADDTFVYTGPVPYQEIASYFAASDVGMYPVDEAVYYDGASPIKIFEYTAAGKPVVVPRIREARRLGFSNLVFAAPDAEPYAEGIVAALEMEPREVPEIEQYDWQSLTDDLDDFLKSVVARHKEARIAV